MIKLYCRSCLGGLRLVAQNFAISSQHSTRQSSGTASLQPQALVSATRSPSSYRGGQQWSGRSGPMGSQLLDAGAEVPPASWKMAKKFVAMAGSSRRLMGKVKRLMCVGAQTRADKRWFTVARQLQSRPETKLNKQSIRGRPWRKGNHLHRLRGGPWRLASASPV